jgi:hypothetical protein
VPLHLKLIDDLAGIVRYITKDVDKTFGVVSDLLRRRTKNKRRPRPVLVSRSIQEIWRLTGRAHDLTAGCKSDTMKMPKKPG